MEDIHIISPNTFDIFSGNRRNHVRETRKDVSVVVERNFLSKDPNRSFLLDISTHGAALCCRKLFKKKGLMRLNLAFGNNINFSLKGEIMHVLKKEIESTHRGKKIHYYQYGIKFIDPPPEFSDYLLGASLKNKLSG
jgi:hypothetical protein